MKRPSLALLVLLLGKGAEAFVVPAPTKPAGCHPAAGAGAGAATGAGVLLAPAAAPRAWCVSLPWRRQQHEQEAGGERIRRWASVQETGSSSSSNSNSRRGAGRRRRRPAAARQGGGGDDGGERRQLPVPAPLPKEQRPLLTNLVSWLASKLIRRTAKKVSGLDIEVGARSNGDVLAGNLPRVQAKFDRIVLESLQISGGGQMEITGLNIRLLALLLARRLSIIRRPFEIFGQYVLTQQDVSASKLIRDLIQLLVNNVLRALFPSLHLTFFDVSIGQVRIRDRKLAIMGTAQIAESDGGMAFTLLTGVGLAGDGHIVYLDNPELVLNPDAPLPVKVPLGSIRAFDVDIGDNARIERIEIDDKLGVSITARTLITPAPPFQVSDVGKRAAFVYDLGAFLSSWFGFLHFSELNLET